MSSNCPPQLHLTLPASTTSFKRSFEQFGFDLEESPVQHSGTDTANSSASDGNDRSKRARSASSFSDDDSSSQSSTIASSSSSSPGTSLSSSVLGNEAHGAAQSAGLSTTRPQDVPFGPLNHFSLPLTRSSIEPPRLPTPEIQDIDMTDYPLVDDDVEEEEEESFHDAPSSPASPHQPPITSTSDDNYRLSLERFTAFDRQTSTSRHSHSPSPAIVSRAPAVPPVLPPLSLLEDGETQTGLNASTNTSAWQAPTPWSAALSQSFYTGDSFYSSLPTPWDGGASHDHGHRDRENPPRVSPEVQTRDEGTNSRGAGSSSTHRGEFSLSFQCYTINLVP